MSESRPHPGPRHPVRRFHSAPARPLHIRAILKPGQSLHEAVWSVLRANGLQAASLSLIGGAFSRLKFTTGAIETRPGSQKQANFTFIRDWMECAMIHGAATAGLGTDGAPLLHCHAVFSDRAGSVRGGHLFPVECHIGAAAIAHITGHPGALIRQLHDEETDHTIFNPITEEAAHVFAPFP